jgi:hypothetical protein
MCWFQVDECSCGARLGVSHVQRMAVGKVHKMGKIGAWSLAAGVFLRLGVKGPIGTRAFILRKDAARV